MQEDDRTFDLDRVAGHAAAELERVSQADHETKLGVLEELYRSLETELDAAGSEALR